MELRFGDVAGFAGIGDHVALLHLVAAIDQRALGMGIGRDVIVVVLDEHEIAVAL